MCRAHPSGGSGGIALFWPPHLLPSNRRSCASSSGMTLCGCVRTVFIASTTPWPLDRYLSSPARQGTLIR
jgi:hypothetical protein